MGNLLSHFSVARASDLKKSYTPHGGPAECLLKGHHRTPSTRIWSGQGRDSWPPVSETHALLKGHHPGLREVGLGLLLAIKLKCPALLPLLENVGHWQQHSVQTSYGQFLFTDASTHSIKIYWRFTIYDMGNTLEQQTENVPACMQLPF